MTSPGRATASRLSLWSIGLYICGTGVVAAVQVGLRWANRSPFPIDGRVALLFVILPIALMATGVEVGRRENYGPAALIASVAMPIQFIAALTMAFAVLLSLSSAPEFPLAFGLAAAIISASGLVSVVVSREYLDRENLRAYVAQGEGD